MWYHSHLTARSTNKFILQTTGFLSMKFFRLYIFYGRISPSDFFPILTTLFFQPLMPVHLRSSWTLTFIVLNRMHSWFPPASFSPLYRSQSSVVGVLALISLGICSSKLIINSWLLFFQSILFTNELSLYFFTIFSFFITYFLSCFNL